MIDESGIDEYLHREYGKESRGEQILTEIPGKGEIEIIYAV
jgi:hypothetical protein